MRRVASWIVLGISLIPLWLVFMRLFGAWGSGWLILITVGYGLLVAALVLVARKVTARGWLLAGLLILAGLFVPTSVLTDNLGSPATFYEPIFQIVVFLLPSIALIMAAVLTYYGLNFLAVNMNSAAAGETGTQTTRDHKGWQAAACFVLSGMLILKTLHNLYWVTVWDTTTDSIGYIWIAVPVLAAIFSGVLLSINLRRWTVLAGLGYLLLVPGLTIAVSYRAQQVDFRQLTETHAGQVGQLIEAYYAREGRYPQNLQQVKPWYLASLPRPFIIYGQDWCYQAGEDYYQLGYVYREHWSSSELISRVYRTGGQPPNMEEICAEEMDALIWQETNFYKK